MQVREDKIESFEYFPLGTIHKRRPQSGGEGPVRTFCGQGILQMRTFALYSAKNPDFSKFVVCPHGLGGGSWASASRRKGNFSWFCADVFYVRPLIHLDSKGTLRCSSQLVPLSSMNINFSPNPLNIKQRSDKLFIFFSFWYGLTGN